MAKIQRAQAPAVFQRAKQLVVTGDLPAAIGLLQSLLASFPNVAEAQFELGRALLATGKIQDGLRALKAARDLKPDEPAIWKELIALSSRTKNSPLSAELTRDIAKNPGLSETARLVLTTHLAAAAAPPEDPPSPEVLHEQEAIKDLLSKHSFEPAAKRAADQMRLHPALPAFVCLLAVATAGLGARKDADLAFQVALMAPNPPAVAFETYGTFLLTFGQSRRAIPILENGMKAYPDDSGVRVNLGLAYLEQRRLKDAQKIIEAIDAHASAKSEFAYAQMYLMMRKAVAIGHFLAAIEGGYDDPIVFSNLSRAYRNTFQDQEAIDALKDGITRHPQNTDLSGELVVAYRNSGDIAYARRVVDGVLSRTPNHPGFVLLHAELGRLTEDDRVLRFAQDRYKQAKLPDHDRRLLAFALAKYSEDTKQPAQLFPYLNVANSLTRRAYPYSVQEDVKFTARVQSVFNSSTPAMFQGQGFEDAAPIFVTGLPRSGTTLVEQILASHPDVAAAGEVGIIGRKVVQLIDALQDPKLPQPDLEEIGREYWGYLTRRFPSASRIVDKSINSYAFIMPLKLIMPNARIVVLRRDPADNALSLYKNMFVDGRHRYSNDLGDIARFTDLFERQVDYWRQAWPESFYELRYEDLVSDLPHHVSQLLEAVDLPWDDACLKFYNQDRWVDTLSNMQVRQPIYSTSVGVAKRFPAEMAPFDDAYKAARRN
jgi:tetratricopeptide (TPR) repeat protein